MAIITIDPTFDIETGKLISHKGQYEIPDSEIPIRFDRSVQKAAKNQSQTNTATGGELSSRGTTEYGAVIPGLVRDVQHPTGYAPTEKSAITTSTGEALGGVNSGVRGLSTLAGMRTRNAAGFAPALAEAAREKGRAAATSAQNLNMSDAELARQRQDAARRELINLYGLDTGNALRSMGLANENLGTELAAGRQGWLQNTEGLLNTISNLGSSAAGVRKAFG